MKGAGKKKGKKAAGKAAEPVREPPVKEKGVGKPKAGEIPERILYPCYFDIGLERGQGRRVPRAMAVAGPTLDDLERAVKRVGIRHRKEAKSHPAHWSRREGRIVAEWKGTKVSLLKKVAAQLEVRGVKA
jgi:signal recognition particle subunit SRP19